MSTQVWVDEVRDMLLSGYVEDLDVITGDVLVGASQIFVQGYASSIVKGCLLYTSPSPRDGLLSRMPSSA